MPIFEDCGYEIENESMFQAVEAFDGDFSGGKEWVQSWNKRAAEYGVVGFSPNGNINTLTWHWHRLNSARKRISKTKLRVEAKRKKQSLFMPNFRYWFWNYLATITDDELLGAVAHIAKIALVERSTKGRIKDAILAHKTRQAAIDRCSSAKISLFKDISKEELEKHLIVLENLYRKHEGPFIWELRPIIGPTEITEDKIDIAKDIMPIDFEKPAEETGVVSSVEMPSNKLVLTDLQGIVIDELERNNHPIFAAILKHAHFEHIDVVEIVLPQNMTLFHDAIRTSVDQYLGQFGVKFVIGYDK